MNGSGSNDTGKRGCRSNNISCHQLKSSLQYLLIIILLPHWQWTQALLLAEPKFVRLSTIDGIASLDKTKNMAYGNTSVLNNRIGNKPNAGGGDGFIPVAGGYLDKLDNLERSVAAVLIKVAYGTTSTTKRSIPDNTYVPSLTTIATPFLTTLRYLEKSSHQQQINLHHRNYELDLERDHALPTSAPNADILKSNSNPTYPNPNRHHNHERERHRHIMNSTQLPSLPNIIKKNTGQSPTISMYPGDIPSYSPPARSFFTPPLPPEYQNPFADKPTLRGTNNEGIVTNAGTYINRRPIPPPSLMPGHERIPFRPPDLGASIGSGSGNNNVDGGSITESLLTGENVSPIDAHLINANEDSEKKKALNTPSHGSNGSTNVNNRQANNERDFYNSMNHQEMLKINNAVKHNTRQEVLPSIRRILSGSNGNRGEIPDVLLKKATTRPIAIYNQPPSSPVVLLDEGNSSQQYGKNEDIALTGSSNINKRKNSEQSNNVEEKNGASTTESSFSDKTYVYGNQTKVNVNSSSSTPATATAVGGEQGVAAAASATSTTSSINSATINKNPMLAATPTVSDGHSEETSTGTSTSTSAAAAAAQSTWTIAWNIHVYFSVILFTILTVYSLYKILTYNKLTHLFSQSYFMCIHFILIVICSARIFYLCYDAYNIHTTFNIFVSELLLNLPATFLTISFSVLILFLFLKALNNKNNRYSALIRPLTVVVGCGVHVVLCVTLHYVESYTLQNQQQQQQLLYKQQQQSIYRRQHLIQQQNYHQQQYAATANLSPSVDVNLQSAFLQTAASTSTMVATSSPPRVLSLICQIIYIFVCLFLGLLYLYLYRILKRILHSKSQNYIHGYQNLSCAIHITIATALLFVLLAALQIFGAISISTTRPLIQKSIAEMDWLQWGYQFSLRLIEIAIITLLSWVAGLKTGGGGSGSVGTSGSTIGNGGVRYGGNNGASSGNVIFGTGVGGHSREKHIHHYHHNPSNVAGFFLPCTSSSSQEQFETDYPAVCNANTNLHTYTMRTGKLIYDDSFALNSLGNGESQSITNSGGATAKSQPTYHGPYDSNSLQNKMTNEANVSDFSTQVVMTGASRRYNRDAPHFADYLTDSTTDHYENPNFDLRSSVNGITTNSIKKIAKTSTSSTTASSSEGSGTSTASQQQMLLLQSDGCYSEPLQPPYSTNYDFSNFESSKLSGNGSGTTIDCWSETPATQPLKRLTENYHSKRDKKLHTTLDRNAYENPGRRSSNFTYSCASSSGRYVGYNSFDRGLYNGVRKSGTLNNITGSSCSAGIGVGGKYGCNSTSSSGASSNISSTTATTQRFSCSQSLALTERQSHQQRSGRVSGGLQRERDHDHLMFGRGSLERSSSHQIQQMQQRHEQQQPPKQNSDEGIMLPGNNAE